MVLTAVALTAFSVLGGAESTTPPATAPLELSWSATPPCASREQIEAEVVRLLRAAAGDERKVVARATLTETETGALKVDLRLEIAGISHQRAFEAESCQAAKSAIALILAIAINPAAAEASARAEAPSSPDTDGSNAADGSLAPNPSPSPSPSPALPRAQPPRTQFVTTPSMPAALSLGLSGLADVGTLPSVSLGGELQLVFQLGRARLEGAGALLGAQDATEATSNAGGTFSALSGHLRFGYGAKVEKIWVGPFVCVGLTRLRASGHGGSLQTSDHTALVPEVGAGGLVSWQVENGLGLRLSAEGLVPTFRPRFVVEEPAPAPNQLVYQSSKVVGRLMLGATIQFL